MEVHARRTDGWHLDVYTSLRGQVPLSAMGVTLTLADVYEQVDSGQGAQWQIWLNLWSVE